MCALATELESVPALPERVVSRLSNAFDRAIDKALSINFSYDEPDEAYVQRSIFRHAERGVRDFVP
jgi:hypothetical protein